MKIKFPTKDFEKKEVKKSGTVVTTVRKVGIKIKAGGLNLKFRSNGNGNKPKSKPPKKKIPRSSPLHKDNPNFIPNARNSITGARGQKSKLTGKTHQIIVTALREGLTNTKACQLAGITRTTMFRWLRYGEKDVSERHRRFYEDCVKAEVDCEHRNIRVVNDAVQGNLTSKKEKRWINKDGEVRGKEIQITQYAPNWQAAMTFLERKYPDRWGRSDRLSVGGDPENPLIPKDSVLGFLVKYVGPDRAPIDVEGRTVSSMPLGNPTMDSSAGASMKRALLAAPTENRKDDDLLRENR